MCDPSLFSEGKPRLRTIEKRTSLILSIILFIVVIIYAGVRIGTASRGKALIQTTGAREDASIAFPAITICPIVAGVAITAIECELEVSQVTVADCLGTTHTNSFAFEGIPRPCITFNDPQSGGAPILAQTSTSDEMEIQVLVNTSQVPQNSSIGVVGVLHPQNTSPVFDEQSVFFGSAGMSTEIEVQHIEETFANNKTHEDLYLSHVNSVITQAANFSAVPTLVIMDFFYLEMETVLIREFPSYSYDAWIGEIGGFSFLMFCLQRVLLFIVVFSASMMCKEEKAQPLPS